MILRLPALIARLSGLDGKPFRNSVLIDFTDEEDLRKIEKLLYLAWRRECTSSRRHVVKRSLDAATWQLRKAFTLLKEE